MRYKYTAFTEKGTLVTDFLYAKNKEEALGRLQNQGWDPEFIRVDLFGVIKDFALSSAGGISFKDKIVFSRNLSVMIKAGMTLDQSLNILSEQTTNPGLGKIIAKVNEDIKGGKTFSESLAVYPRVFSELYVNIVAASERGGTLSQSLEHLSLQLSQQYDLRAKIRGALFYPVLVVTATLVTGVLLSIFVLPKITRLFVSFKAELPLTTRILISFSELITNSGLIVILIVVLIVAAVLFFTRSRFFRPVWHRLLLSLPIVGTMSRYFNLALFTRTLGTLSVSGVAISEALEITGNTLRNVKYRAVIEEVVPLQKTGETLGNLLMQHPSLFPPIVHRMIAVGEESGNLEEVLNFLAEFYENEIDYISKNLSTILEPLLLIVIGVIVGVIALAIITPIYQITGSFTF